MSKKQRIIGYVDIALEEAVGFEKVKRFAADVYDELLKLPDGSSVELAYSGAEALMEASI